MCLFCVVMSGCKQSAKSRLVGKWKISGKATVAKMNEETKKSFGGEKSAIQMLNEFWVEYKKDGTYLASGDEKGVWSVSEDEKTISVMPKDKKEEKLTIVEVSGTQLVVNNVPNINTSVIYEAVK